MDFTTLAILNNIEYAEIIISYQYYMRKIFVSHI